MFLYRPKVFKKKLDLLILPKPNHTFFQLVVTSLLFVNDDVNGNIWMIDFGKSFKSDGENGSMVKNIYF